MSDSEPSGRVFTVDQWQAYEDRVRQVAKSRIESWAKDVQLPDQLRQLEGELRESSRYDDADTVRHAVDRIAELERRVAELYEYIDRNRKMGIASDLRDVVPNIRRTMNGYVADIVTRAADRLDELEAEPVVVLESVPYEADPSNLTLDFESVDSVPATPADEPVWSSTEDGEDTVSAE